MTEIKNVGIIVSKLRKRYKGKISMLGSFGAEKKDPFFMLISTILSARNRDEVTHPLSVELFSKLKRPEDFVKVPIGKLEKMIKRSGFFRQKAKRIKEVSKIIIEKYDGKVPDTMEDLTALPGVGKKTAGCVMVYAFDKEEIPVDIHVQVISQRLGWSKEKTPDKINADLKERIPKIYWKWINELLVVHGKEICDTARPKCRECPIFDECLRIGVDKKFYE